MLALLNKRVLLFFFLVLFLPAQSVVNASNIRALLFEAQQGGSYVPADVTELEKAESLFLSIFRGDDMQLLKTEWSAVGFDLLEIRENETNYIVVQEKAGRKEGRGFYLFRGNTNSISVFQAPHSFKDLRTGEIAFDLIVQSDYAAAAWNTVPRRYLVNNETVNADLAHLQYTFIIAFTRAFAQHFVQGNVLQIHGYAQSKRTTAEGKQSEFIISSGTALPTNTLIETTQCLKQKVSDNTKVYPQEVKELGGTANTIGAALRELGHKGFMHIEISREVRERLLKETNLQNNFDYCLPN